MKTEDARIEPSLAGSWSLVRLRLARLLADDEGTETLESLMLLACVVLPIIIGLIQYKNNVMQNFKTTWDELTRG